MSEDQLCVHYVCTHEKALELIRASKFFSLSNCGCREAKGSCARSRLDVCLSFDPADPGSGSGSRPIGLEEALGVFAEAEDKRLISRPWRTEDRKGTAGICFCCDDCCGYFADQNEHCDKGAMIEQTDTTGCTNCGACLPACHFGARRTAEDGELAVERDRCFGCGLCVPTCPTGCISMVSRS